MFRKSAGTHCKQATEAYATTLAAMDTSIAEGSEDRVTDNVLRITGRQPSSLADFAARHKAVWRAHVEA